MNAIVAALTKLSDRLDMMPVFREATVTGIVPVTVKFDTDDTSVRVQGNLYNGALGTGDRVMTMQLRRYVWILGRANVNPRGTRTQRGLAAAVSATNNAWTTLVFAQEIEGGGALSLDTSVDPTRGELTLGETGMYALFFQATFSPNNTGRRVLRIANPAGTAYVQAEGTVNPTQSTTVQATMIGFFAAGTRLKFEAFQSSGAALAISTTNSATYINAAKLN